MTSFVWSVEVVGNKKIETDGILNALKNTG